MSVPHPIKTRKPTNNISIISFADLWAMYEFVKSEPKLRPGEGPLKPHMHIQKRLKEIEEELYERTYGYNPWHKTSDLEGKKPEDIDLSKFDDRKE